MLGGCESAAEERISQFIDGFVYEMTRTVFGVIRTTGPIIASG